MSEFPEPLKICIIYIIMVVKGMYDHTDVIALEPSSSWWAIISAEHINRLAGSYQPGPRAISGLRLVGWLSGGPRESLPAQSWELEVRLSQT